MIRRVCHSILAMQILTSEVKTKLLRTKVEKEILWGEKECLKYSKKRVVRVFISSTFTDTKTERNYLLKEVFPQVREYCQARGVEFR